MTEKSLFAFLPAGSLLARAASASGTLVVWIVGAVLIGAVEPSAAQSAAKPAILYVNPLTGRDRPENGTQTAPLRTIRYALMSAKSETGAVIQLARGTYSTASGEAFPLKLEPGIIIRGDETTKGQGIVIVGGGEYSSPFLARQDVAILAGDRAELRGVTVVNRNTRGYGLWLESTSPAIANNTFSNSQEGAFVTGNSTALFSNNVFIDHRGNAMSVEGSARPILRGNVFRRSGFGISIRQNAAPQLTDNLIAGNQDGILVQSEARPQLRNNLVERNYRHGLVVLANAQPDLGSTTDPGGNVFRNNGRGDVLNSGQAAQNTAQNLEMTSTTVTRQLLPATVSPGASPIESPSPKFLAQPLASPSTVTVNETSQFRPGMLAVPPLSNPREPFVPIPVPNSVVVKITPEANDSSLVNPTIDGGLRPVVSRPPSGEPVNRPIAIAPRANTYPEVIKSTARYRVIVPVASELNAMEVRRLIPNSFPSRLNGRLVMQVGAYSERSLADAQVRTLGQSGIAAAIEKLP